MYIIEIDQYSWLQGGLSHSSSFTFFHTHVVTILVFLHYHVYYSIYLGSEIGLVNHNCMCVFDKLWWAAIQPHQNAFLISFPFLLLHGSRRGLMKYYLHSKIILALWQIFCSKIFIVLLKLIIYFWYFFTIFSLFI